MHPLFRCLFYASGLNIPFTNHRKVPRTIHKYHSENFEAESERLLLEPKLTQEQTVWPLLCLAEFYGR
jgi:hypothetical protein